MLARKIAFLIGTLYTVTTFGTVLNLSTSTANNWVITSGGAVDAPAYPFATLSGISVTSTGGASGTFLSGGSVAQFNGFWYADADFQLPSTASSVSLAFSGLAADDRVVLQLNGTTLGDYFLNGFGYNPPLTGPGKMSFPPGPPDASYTFTGIQAGTVTNGFVLGGTNDLRLIVNNTDLNSLTAPTIGFQNGDSTYAELVASVSYTTVPEPSALAVLGISFLGLLRRRRRSR